MVITLKWKATWITWVTAGHRQDNNASRAGKNSLEKNNIDNKHVDRLANAESHANYDEKLEMSKSKPKVWNSNTTAVCFQIPEVVIGRRTMVSKSILTFNE